MKVEAVRSASQTNDDAETTTYVFEVIDVNGVGTGQFVKLTGNTSSMSIIPLLRVTLEF